ncbi:MAG: MalY/PatB family protein [Christensenellales bacterium]
MQYNFDEIIDRRHTNAVNVEAYRTAIFNDPEREISFCRPEDELIRMWVADMEFATPDVIIDGIRKCLNQRIFGYTRVYEPAYFEALAHWTQTHYGWTFPKEQLVTSNGIVPALYELVDYICAPDEKVLIFTPSYGPFRRAADLNHRECLHSDLLYDDGCYTIDWQDVAAKLDDPKVTLCIFCNPHNPTGRLWTQEELQKLGELCIQRGVWIISDEIHCDLLRTGKSHIPLAKLFPEYPRVITCMAPSKTFNIAGLMFSNIIIPDKPLRKKWLSCYHNSDNPLSIAAAQAAYESGTDWLEGLRVYLDSNLALVKETLSQRLPKAIFRIPDATYLAWIDLRAYFDPEEDLSLFFAQNAGVLLEGSKMFVQNADGFIRLSLACPRATVQEAMRRICDAVNARDA